MAYWKQATFVCLVTLLLSPPLLVVAILWPSHWSFHVFWFNVSLTAVTMVAAGIGETLSD